MFRYAVTIFLSAFLLFQVQPLIGKFILPWFGGTPAVWTTCMLFFQAALLAGYSYAHFLSSKVSPRGQMITHLALLAASLAFLPIGPAVDWKPLGDEMPIGRILGLLTASIGLPYVMLSTTGPLLQESYRRETGHPPYRLYALSNAGSLLALLTYPFLFEPELTLQTQIWLWSGAYLVFALFCGWCALAFVKPAHHPDVVDEIAGKPGEAVPQNTGARRGRDILLWLALAACGSAVLLATTNLLCQEICSVPLLWVLPLALYLTTFIICFDHERWYNRGVFYILLFVSIGGAIWGLNEGTRLELWKQLAIFGGAMWVCCMVCHGELVKAKPAPRYATLFYLMVSAGGVIGGLLVAVVAPLVLNDFWEYHMSIVATLILAVVATMRNDEEASQGWVRWLIGSATMVGLGVVLAWLVSANWTSPDSYDKVVETSRNFYGVLHVKREDDPEDERGSTIELIHGRIQHGFQFEDPMRRNWATTYYGPTSGVGIAIEQHPRRGQGGMRIGVIGLGCGTLATYGRKGDYIRFYEINPQVLRISNEYFTFRKDSPAELEIVLGDARIKMERERDEKKSQQFDVLAVDAFSSDAIPMHLLTLECARVFMEHLKPDGILCLHISNRFLDLQPVVHGIADALEVEAVVIESDSDADLGLNHSTWVLLTRNKEFLANAAVEEAATDWEDPDARILWTDDYGSLWQALSKDQKTVSIGGEE